MKRLLVVDGTALAFRAFFAVRHLTDNDGNPTGALFGYLAALLRALEDHPADAVAVAWDRSEPTFRHELDKEYKANREDLDQDLAVQFPHMREVTGLLGIASLDQAGFEADDILASLAQHADEDWEVRMFTSDKDMAQLVSERVLQCPPPKQGQPAELFGPAEIEEKFGVPPQRMIDWQALVGDSTDNIPGVPGVGPKTASKLLQKYGDLETVLERGPDEEKGKLAERLRDHADDARRARVLVALRTDLEVPTLEALGRATPDWDGLAHFCAKHDLNTLGRRLSEMASGGDGEATAEEPAATSSAARTEDGPLGGKDRNEDYRLVRTSEELVALREGLQASGGFAFDTETTSIDPMRARLVGMSFAWQDGSAWYVAQNLPEPPVGPDGESALDFLRPVLEDPEVPKRGQNLKYDAQVMRRHGVTVRGWDFDTMVAHFLAAPTEPHNLDALSLQYLGMRKIPTSELLGRGKKALTMDLVPVDAVAEYACEDADAVQRLLSPLRAALAEVGAEELFRDLEMPLVEVLRSMEANGVRIDRERLAGMRKGLEKRVGELEKKVHALADEPFNLNSPKQLGTILFEKLRIQDAAGVKRVARTKTGYRTDAQTLERYQDVPIVAGLLEFRQLSKLVGTYVAALPDYIHPETGCIHTSFNQAVASTGRLSSSDPNLQNIPIRSEAGRRIRSAFVPLHDDWLMLSADYSQVELRVVAHLSGDPGLLDAFREGVDVHTRTAELVFGADPDSVDTTMRSRAKAVNFGILYGMGSQRLARETGMSQNEAKEFIERYFEKLPGVRAWLDRTLEEAQETGEVRTLLGRRRPVPELASADGRIQAQGRNIAVNTPVQGSAADLMKLAMLRVHERLARENLKARMLLQVHDELVLDLPEAELDKVTALLREEMEGVYPLDVPLVVDVGHGRDWASAH